MNIFIMCGLGGSIGNDHSRDNYKKCLNKNQLWNVLKTNNQIIESHFMVPSIIIELILHKEKINKNVRQNEVN